MLPPFSDFSAAVAAPRQAEPEARDQARFTSLPAENAWLPTSARQFQIADLQHWIDLCA